TDGLQLVHELMGHTGRIGTRVLLLDEVHEWNLNQEVLVAWVRKETERFPGFKVVLMSATLESEKLSSFFRDATVIEVPGRLFPVTIREPGVSVVSDVVDLASQGRNVLVFQPGKAEIETTIGHIVSSAGDQFVVLPLHGELESSEQRKCFQHYGRPKIVVATNVAQTSITIDDIDAVVDSGLERRVELVEGVEGLYLKSISKADSKQRAGRAGRTKPGIYIDHCKDAERLEFPKAEIERVRLDQTVLRLAEVGFDMEELRFFHQPDIKAIHEAKEDLKKLGCLYDDGSVTAIGQKVARLPISVQFGRMVVEADRLGVVKDMIMIAAILEVGEINQRKTKEGYDNNEWRRYIDNESGSDVIAQLNLYKKAELMSKDEMNDAGIRIGAFYRVRETRRNLEKALRRFVYDTESEGSRESVIKTLCSGMVNHLYKRDGIGYTNGDGIARQIGKESVLRSRGEFIIGLPFDLEIKTRFGMRTLNLVRMATAVTPELLIEVAPQLLTKKTGLDPYYSVLSGCVISTTETLFNGTVISTEAVEDREHPRAVELQIDKMYEGAILRVDTRDLYFDDPYVDVPDVRQEEIGKHPTTGEALYIYETYIMSYYSNVRAERVRYKTKEEADEKRELLITRLSEIFGKNTAWFKLKNKQKPESVVPKRWIAELTIVKNYVEPEPEFNKPATIAEKLAALAERYNTQPNKNRIDAKSVQSSEVPDHVVKIVERGRSDKLSGKTTCPYNGRKAKYWQIGFEGREITLADV
ncbi:MAG TPA: helicase-related protein, partial [Anaerolineales bacterium]|nr:helicase-related protein [Anaerolineales bacterium]